MVGVDFWAINTDAQALGHSKTKGAKLLNIGGTVTCGLGASRNPKVGQMATEESQPEIATMVVGTDLCFIMNGMGRKTGSGPAPIKAEVAKEARVLTIGFIMKSF